MAQLEAVIRIMKRHGKSGCRTEYREEKADMKYLSEIEEASYLSVPNAGRYRLIMRSFFREYEKMNFQLYKEDVLELVRQQDEYTGYTSEQLLLDLDSLVRWKNLVPIQDPGRVYTIAEYKNKQYRYVMSENAVEIERMTIRLENLFVEGGNLSANLFVRIEKSLEEVEDRKNANAGDNYAWWMNLQEDFRRLNQNYQDYLREFYSGKTDSLMKSVEFVLHKDRFIQYLNEFIVNVQKYSQRIAKTIKKISPVMEECLLDQIIISEMEIPHASRSDQGRQEKLIRENVYGRWNSLTSWFVDQPNHICECQKILVITQDIIRNLIQNAAMIVQIQNWGVSRKEDYKKFLTLFQNAKNLEEAHCLSAHIFGIQSIAHLKANMTMDSDGINNSVYQEEAMEYCFRPRVQTYKERRKQQGFSDKALEKYMQRMEYLRNIDMEKQLVMKYINNDRVVFSQINDVIPEGVRSVFLQWISNANISMDRVGRTEYGQRYRVIRREGYCTLHCEDGDLKMPAYELEFMDE